MTGYPQLTAELHTLRDYLRWGMSEFGRAGLFFGHGCDNAYDEALGLLTHALSMPADSPTTLLDARLTEAEKTAVINLFRRRISERIPAAYLTREAWFSGLSFYVDERVLVPRSPIAELIENGFAPWLVSEPHRILDLCTGSGCIGIACAYAFQTAAVDLVDISADACDVANINVARHELGQRVQVLESDLFADLGEQRYDLIVSNPPYVDEEDLADMPEEYRREPVLGLTAGRDGLSITRRILREAADYLTDDGVLVVEVGNSCIALDDAFPDIAFTWLDFERGGHGVFVIDRPQLLSYAAFFAQDGE